MSWLASPGAKAAPLRDQPDPLTGLPTFDDFLRHSNARHLASAASLLSQHSARSGRHAVTPSLALSHVFSPDRADDDEQARLPTPDEAARIMTPNGLAAPAETSSLLHNTGCAGRAHQGGQASQAGAAPVVCQRWPSPKRRLTSVQGSADRGLTQIRTKLPPGL